MKLAGFRYLGRGHILTLALLLTLSSTLFSITALSLLGFYRGFSAYLGEGEDIIAVYNPKSRTPYTSSVPAYLADRLASVNGISATSPEVTAPCLLNGQAVFLRGVMPESLVKLNPLAIVEGAFLNQRDINSAIVGKKVAEKLGLKLNDRLLFQGVFADRYVELQVKGVFTSNSIIEDEVLAPLHVGQWLRGMDYNRVTLIRLKIDRNTVTPNEIFKVVAVESARPANPTQPSELGEPQSTAQEPIMPWATARFSLEDVSVEEAAEYMRDHMDRYGVTREALLTLSAVVFLFSSSTVVLASKTMVTQHRGEINVLRALGTPKRLLRIDMLTKLLPWVLAASTAGMLVASAILRTIQGYGYLQVLSHTVPFQFDPLVAALNFMLAFMLVSISIFKRGKFRSRRKSRPICGGEPRFSPLNRVSP